MEFASSHLSGGNGPSLLSFPPFSGEVFSGPYSFFLSIIHLTVIPREIHNPSYFPVLIFPSSPKFNAIRFNSEDSLYLCEDPIDLDQNEFFLLPTIIILKLLEPLSLPRSIGSKTYLTSPLVFLGYCHSLSSSATPHLFNLGFSNMEHYTSPFPLSEGLLFLDIHAVFPPSRCRTSLDGVIDIPRE